MRNRSMLILWIAVITLISINASADAHWGPAVGEDGVTNVTNYVRKLAGLEHDAEAAAAGMASYNTICIACHTAEGGGNPLLGSPDINNDIWLYGGSVEEISFTLTHGRQGNMPAQTDILTDDKIHILTTYVRSLSQ